MQTRRENLVRMLSLVSAPVVATLALPHAAQAQVHAFDHNHQAWTALLRRHVRLTRQGSASQLHYAGMKADRAALTAYLNTLSSVSKPAFSAFTQAEQMAFLINAYNAFTVELVLTAYPKLKSIKEIGGIFSNPWKQDFIPLLGQRLSLDAIEHGMLREPGRYDDPRIHFAVNCASVGCPMLREEAFVGAKLDAQLSQQATRFMTDPTRNRFNVKTNELEVSKIFDWYGADFRAGHRGISSLPQFLAGYADQLTSSSQGRALIKAQKAAVVFLDYDWAINDVHKAG